MVYWSGKPYMAFGLGAASYTGWHRFSRPKSMAAYKTWVSDLAKGLIQGNFTLICSKIHQADIKVYVGGTCSILAGEEVS